MAVTDPAFESLLEQEGDVRALWRVQKLELVEVPKRCFEESAYWGKFYTGDCYLLYDKRVQDGQDEHVHFWIGAECSVDEQAVAAIKAVELDNLFGGLPVQHREAQGHESARFKSLFPDGLIILNGGMESGLKKVESGEDEAKMFHVKGGMKPVLTQVPLAWSSMNHGDTFVLDSGKKIFVWAGEGSSGIEKMAAAGLAGRLRDHWSESVVHVTDGAEEEECDEEWTEHLPLEDKGEVKDKEEAADASISQEVAKEISLHKVSDMTGEMTTELVKSGELSEEDLEGQDAFLVDGGQLGIWIWLGRHSSQEERKAVVGMGQKFLADQDLPPHTPLARCFQGGEPEEFRSLFTQWSH